MRKLTTGPGEDYTALFLLDCDYIKNHYRLIAVDLSRQKQLDADPKAIQQIEFIGLLKKPDANYKATDASNNESMFILTTLNQRNEIKIFSRKCNSIITNYSDKLSRTESYTNKYTIKQMKTCSKK